MKLDGKERMEFCLTTDMYDTVNLSIKHFKTCESLFYITVQKLKEYSRTKMLASNMYLSKTVS